MAQGGLRFFLLLLLGVSGTMGFILDSCINGRLSVALACTESKLLNIGTVTGFASCDPDNETSCAVPAGTGNSCNDESSCTLGLGPIRGECSRILIVYDCVDNGNGGLSVQTTTPKYEWYNDLASTEWIIIFVVIITLVLVVAIVLMMYFMVCGRNCRQRENTEEENKRTLERSKKITAVAHAQATLEREENQRKKSKSPERRKGSLQSDSAIGSALNDELDKAEDAPTHFGEKSKSSVKKQYHFAGTLEDGRKQKHSPPPQSYPLDSTLRSTGDGSSDTSTWQHNEMRHGKTSTLPSQTGTLQSGVSGGQYSIISTRTIDEDLYPVNKAPQVPEFFEPDPETMFREGITGWTIDRKTGEPLHKSSQRAPAGKVTTAPPAESIAVVFGNHSYAPEVAVTPGSGN